MEGQQGPPAAQCWHLQAQRLGLGWWRWKTKYVTRKERQVTGHLWFFGLIASLDRGDIVLPYIYGSLPDSSCVPMSRQFVWLSGVWLPFDSPEAELWTQNLGHGVSQNQACLGFGIWKAEVVVVKGVYNLTNYLGIIWCGDNLVDGLFLFLWTLSQEFSQSFLSCSIWESSSGYCPLREEPDLNPGLWIKGGADLFNGGYMI